MKMEFLIFTLFAVLTVLAQSQEETEIDWSKVKPISELPALKAHRKNQATVYESNGNRRIIVGGVPAKKSQFPFQAALLMKVTGSPFLCGGSLISSTRVLTTAHCTKDASSATVMLGSVNIFEYDENQVRFDVPESGIISHPDYDPKTLQNDLGMIKFPNSVVFDKTIRPIDLPKGSDDFVGENGVASGWGDFDFTNQISPILRYANLKVIENSECRNEFPDIIYDSTMCASDIGNVGTCHGDSGGPFTVRRIGLRILVGITSFGSESECGNGHPTAFVRISSFIPWILSNIN